MQHDRGDDDAVGDEVGDHLGRQRPSGRRHLGRARLGRRTSSCRRRSATSRARSGSGSAGRGGTGARAAAPAGRAWRPTAAPSRHPPEQRHRAAAGDGERRAGRGRRGPGRSSRRGAGGGPRRGAARSAARSRGGRRRPSPSAVVASRAAGIVADVLTTTQVARPQPRGQVAGGACGAADAHRSTPSCARRRGARASARAARSPPAPAAGRSRRSGDSVATAVIGRPRRRRRPPRWRPLGASPSIRATMPGTTSSGSGRSEMSSPGNASWCIWVRMSPGSMVSTRTSGRSAASTRPRWSSAAFVAP